MKKLRYLICIIFACLILVSFASCMEDGKSAYEIALENGFTGSEAEWLQYIRGMNGEDGKDAKDITIDDLFQAAKEDGYTGSLVDFIKEIYGSEKAFDDKFAINKALLTSVSVYCTFKKNGTTTKDKWTGEETTTESEYASAGSGVIYSINKETGDAIIITNYHVVYDKDSNTTNHISNDIFVLLYGSEFADYKVSASYVGGSLTYDIAVLEVKGSEVIKNSSAMPIEFASSDDVVIGSSVFAIGNPEADGISVTSGIVSVDSEYINMTGADGQTPVEFRVMRVDAPVNSGNSGGGLFNSDGKLIGIVNAKIMADDIENIGYAIPSNIALAITKNILHYCQGTTIEKVQKCLIGVQVTSKNVHAVYDAETSLVHIEETVYVAAEIEQGVLAYGKLQKGDEIVKIIKDGKEIVIDRMYKLIDNILASYPGDEITYVVNRPNYAADSTEENEIIESYTTIEVVLTLTEESQTAIN